MYWASAHPFNLFIFVFGHRIVSCSQASNPREGEKCIMVIWTGLVLTVIHRLKWLFKPLVDWRGISYSVVNLIWVVVVCVYLRWDLNMYIWEAGYHWCMLNEALSFGTTIMPSPSCLVIMIKVMINEVNSVACTVGAWHNVWT